MKKIEGEASLDFFFKKDKIDFVDISFLHHRSIEKILENKNALDALVINPRVCGICGHAHLIATVQALENCYEDIQISNKAKILRELTLNFELVQNHFKWFCLNLSPLFQEKQDILKASKPTQIISKAIASIAGQYPPHNSYAIVGGVVCDITQFDVFNIKNYINKTLKYFEDNMLESKISMLENIDDLINNNGDLANILNIIKSKKWESVAKSYDKFIVFGANSYFDKGKYVDGVIDNDISLQYIKEYNNDNSYAKNVEYSNSYYEVGPLARAMINNDKLIKSLHNKYQDSLIARISARVLEIPKILNYSLSLLDKIDLNEPSFIEPKIDISQISAYGSSAVEAARGSLIHKVHLKNGMIQKYDIITPTQWNLSNGTKEKLGISQKAMIGLDSIKLAQIAFKSFDVCSVCTTH